MLARRYVLTLALLLAGAANLHAQNVETSFAEAQAAFGQGRFREAARHYRAALLWPGAHTARAHHNLGACYLWLGEWPAAAAAFRAAMRAEPRNFFAAYGLGLALTQTGETTDAAHAFRLAVEWSKEGHAGALFELGTRLALDGADSEAQRWLRLSLNFAGAHVPAAHNNLAVLLARAGRVDEAEAELAAAIKAAGGNFAAAEGNLQQCRLVRRKPAVRIASWRVAVSNVDTKFTEE
jgi:tetratricopeptide (TPR) repeat protein